MKLETIENSIYWQKHVISKSHCPKQKARCKLAIEKLLKQLIQLKSELA